MELTDREQTVIKNVWGEDVPTALREIETEHLMEMHKRVSKAVQACYDETKVDRDSLGILLPLEGKIVQVLHERI